MSPDNFVHIVPSLPPAINALADYCYKLWEHWPQPRPRWTCLTPHVPAGAREFWPAAELVPFDLNRQSLVWALQSCDAKNVALHYVGYAYNAKGAPVWLPGALRAWKRRTGGRLCVIFHELWPIGFSPRSSAYWLAPFTKRIVAQLAQTADSWISSCELAHAQLVEKAGADPARGRIVPIGANIEPDAPIAFDRPWPLDKGEKLRIAVFGLPGTRLASLELHARLAKSLVEANAVEKISLIGKTGDEAYEQALRRVQSRIAPLDSPLWAAHYDLSGPQISALLADHHCDFSRNSPELLFKSGAYAAACVHGLLSICPPSNAELLRAADVTLNADVTKAPHLLNDDNQAEKSFAALHDGEIINELRRRIRFAASHTLDWSSIVSQWQQSMELRGG